MADHVFIKDDAGIRSLLQSGECLQVMEQYARSYAPDGEYTPFVGFDRAKCFVKQETKEK